MARKKDDGKGRIGGRGKGSKNKVTIEVKSWIAQVIDNNREQVENDLLELEPKDRLLILEKLMQYVVPKQQSVQATIDYNRLSDEQLNTVIQELTQNIE